MCSVIHFEWHAEQLDEALGILRGPTVVHFTIFAELRLREVVVTVYTHRLQGVRTKLEDSGAVDMALRRSEERLHVGHHRLKILTLVEEHAVPVGDLILPVLLPLAQSRLLEQAVCLNDDLRSSGLEAYPPLDTDDRVTHIAVAADGIACTDLLNLLNGFHLVIEMLAIDSLDLTFLESDTQLCLRLLRRDMFQISALRQTLGRIEKFTATDTRAPDTYIVTVFEFREVGSSLSRVSVMISIFGAMT